MSSLWVPPSRDVRIGSGADPSCHSLGRGLGIFPESKAAVAWSWPLFSSQWRG